MIAFPNAKLNLGLFVTGRRPDGFHDIASVFYPVALCDVLEIVSEGVEETSFHSTGIAIPGDQAGNLCLKAYELLKADFSLPAVQIHLHKVVPIGAGLGGGSADGAFALKLLNDLFRLELSQAVLETYAARLGSDCPFFVANTPAYVTGRGEELEPFSIDLSAWKLVLVNPGIHIGTAEAYAHVVPKKPADSLRELLSKPVSEWRKTVVNQFEDSIFLHYPQVAAIKAQLYAAGAVYASMTGSGSSVFGLFREEVPLDFAPGVWSRWVT